MSSDTLTTVVAALLGGGLLNFVISLIKRKTELRQVTATTESFTVLSAEKAVASLAQALDVADSRVTELRAELKEANAQMTQLEVEQRSMHRRIIDLEDDLTSARAKLASLRPIKVDPPNKEHE